MARLRAGRRSGRPVLIATGRRITVAHCIMAHRIGFERSKRRARARPAFNDVGRRMEYRVIMVDGVWCVVAIMSREPSKEAAKTAVAEFVAVDRASERIRQAACEMPTSEMTSFLRRMPEKGNRTPESIEAWLRALPRARNIKH